jgi:coenzyme F420 hydrogenase subunit beta
MKIANQNISLIVKKRICCGCGGCSVICPQACIVMVNGRHFNYPEVHADQCTECGKCIDICPSTQLLKSPGDEPDVARLNDSYDYWISHANDDAIRMEAASGGFISALLIHLLRSQQIDGAVVTCQDDADPLVNRSFIATDEQGILAARGSRYGPVSSCAILNQIIERPGSYAFVGKPCEIQALRKLQALIPELDKRIHLSIGLFCACTPPRSNTASFLAEWGVKLEGVRKIQYRGTGWPGSFRATNGERTLLERPYMDAWSHLVSNNIPIRCMLCFDTFADKADLSVGDPWGEEFITSERKGLSLVVARSDRAKENIQRAEKSGAISLRKSSRTDVLAYQKALLGKTRRARAKVLVYQLISQKRLQEPLTLWKNRFPMGRSLLRQYAKPHYY